MITTVSSRHQITIPKSIAVMFNLRKGDVLEVERQDNKIIMIPKEVILEDKYPMEDLKTAEKVLSEGVPGAEVKFKSGNDMVRFFKNKTKK